MYKMMLWHQVLKLYQPKTFHVVFYGAREINQTIIQLV